MPGENFLGKHLPCFGSSDEPEKKKRNRTLPEVILVTVFKLLQAEDRKNVRLSSRHWKELCFECAKYEKFVFGHRAEEVADLQKRIKKIQSHCLRSDIEFHNSLPSCGSVWSHLGNRMTSLRLYNCDINGLTFENIVVECPSLQHFYIHYKEFEQRFLHWEATLDNLIAENVVRKELLSLKLYILYDLKNEELKKMYQVFPCIRTLGIGSFHRADELIARAKEEDDHLEEWALPPNIENFYSNSIVPVLWKMPEITRLKKLKMIMNLHNQKYLANIGAFLSKQFELKSLKLYVCAYGSEEAASTRMARQVLFNALWNTPKLKQLEFGTLGPLRFTTADFEEFLKSTTQLEALSLTCEKFVIDEPNEAELKLSTTYEYSALKKLLLCTNNVSSNPSEELLAFEILNRCCTSLKEMQNLRTLSINLPDYAMDEGIFNNKFPNLEHLQLRIPAKKVETSSFDFPNLKHLDISLYGADKKFEKEMLNKILDQLLESKHLKILSIKPISFSKLTDEFHIEKLMSLEFLRFSKNVFLLENFETLTKLFQECPVIKNIAGCDEEEAFCYDASSKKVRTYKLGRLFHKHNPFQPFSMEF